MANEIYKQTHKGLAGMISARAATNVLQKALKANSFDDSFVDYLQMKTCLQGYVYEELRNVLPSQGLKRQIKGILRDISTIRNSEAVKRSEVVLLTENQPDVAVEGLVEQAAMAVSEPHSFIPNQTDVAAVKNVFDDTTKPDAVAAVAEDVVMEDFDSIFDKPMAAEPENDAGLNIIIEDIDMFKVGESSSIHKHDDISDDLFQSAALVDKGEPPKNLDAKVALVPNKTAKKQMVRKKLRKSVDFSSKDLSDLEELLQVFALVEGTKAVAIVHSNGKLVNSRGKGYDLDSLAKLSNMALRLLKKSGDIRSYHLFVDNSQLFLFPVAEYMIVVIGSEEINFGEIVSAFAAFEEEK